MSAPPRSSELSSSVGGFELAQDRSQLHYIQAIDGLRAVAVIAVVLNHIDFPGSSSGFVGVDIFFAISGYLITRQIVTKQIDGRPQPLLEFWAGRARRIVPAMVLVIALTCLGSAVFLAPQELERVGFYGLASDFFGMNVAAAARGGNYFDGPLRQSPFLHMWSLGVEEQFYLLWPLILGPIVLLTSRWLRLSRQRTMAVALALLGVASLLASVTQTSSSPLWAFYGLHTRLYEFILGGAAAIFWRSRLDRRAQRMLTFGGVGALAASLALTPADAGFPGAWPLLAVLGSVALILGFTHGEGTQRYSVAAVLSLPPLRRIGRYSYSWYLWHWPALVLTLAATNDNQMAARIACIASLVPAAWSFHFVEQRVRLAPTLVGSAARSLAMGAVALAFGASCAVGVVLWGRVGVADPQVAEWVQTEESFRPANCELNRSLLGADVCLGGSTDPRAPVVLLVGDSHAGQWVDAFSRAGRANGFAVALRQYGNCPAALLLDQAEDQNADNLGCASFQKETVRLVADDRVAAVVMTDAGSSRRKFESIASWRRGAERMDEAAADSGVPVGLLVDNPNWGDPLRCLSRGFSTLDCMKSKDAAFSDLRAYSGAENHLSETGGVSRLDLTEDMCPDNPCPLKVDGTWVVARGNHLARAFTTSQVDRVGAWTEELIRGD